MIFKKSKIFSNWEYWPSFMFYIPLVPYAVYLAIRARSLVYFSATNPGLKHSGNGSESKYATLQMIPPEFRPISLLIESGSTISEILSDINKNKINYPVIGKPDIGFRGLLVKKIKNEIELKNYCKRYGKLDLIVQSYVDYDNECGIFYHKMPHEKKGNISSITLKKYLKILGDGKSTLIDLIKKHPRAKRYFTYLKSVIGDQQNLILKNGEEKVLSTIGNHSKGTQFLNGNHLIDLELTSFFDDLFNKIPGLYYGRVDLKYDSLESLKKGEQFKVLEINGIISEPTHIYDPYKSSYIDALKAIKNHWKIMYRIAVYNNRLKGIPFDQTGAFIKSLFKIKRHQEKIKNLI